MKVSIIVMTVLAGLLASGMAEEKLSPSPEYWRSEAFLKSFNASYRINARVEPYVETQQRGLLVKVGKLMAEQKREAALQTLKASELTKRSAALRFNQGNIEFELGKLKDAQASYQAAIERFPTFLRAHQNLAVVAFRLENKGLAQKSVLKAVSLGSQSAGDLGLLGYLYLQQGKEAQALEAFSKAQLTEAENVEWLAGQAICLDRLGEHGKAVGMYESLIAAQPKREEYRQRLAYLYERMGKEQEALVLYEMLRRQGQLSAERTVNYAVLHLLNSSPRVGVRVMDELFAGEHFANGAVALEVVERCIDFGMLSEAKRYFQKIQTAWLSNEAEKTRYARTGAWLVIASKQGGQDLAQAVQRLEAIVAVEPQDAQALFLLGSVKMGEDELEAAELLFGQGVAGVGEYRLDCQRLQGQVLLKMARYEEALKVFESYQKAVPTQQVAEYIAAVKHLWEASK